MKEVLLSPLKKERTFLVYCLIGVTGVSLDYVAFLVLVNVFTAHYQTANAISVSLGIINNFFLNSFLNFKVQDRWVARFVSFYSVGLLGLALSASILHVVVSMLHYDANLTKLFTLFVVVVTQYNLNRLISFRNP